MAKILISLSGEGRGHATRVRAIADYLRRNHQVGILAAGDAFDLLAPTYRGSEVQVRRIPCLRFHYNCKNRLDLVKTALSGARYIHRFPRLRRRIETLLRKERPDLVISDFEPALPRAARTLNIPFISLNHQHVLVVSDLRCLPPRLRWQARFMGLIVRCFYTGQALTIVSSFYFYPLRSRYSNVTQVGVLLRPAVHEAPRGEGPHLVAYLRRSVPDNVLHALEQCGRPVRVYGLGERPSRGKVTFHFIEETGFLRDLGTCTALVCTAGNQVVGEALFLGKPVLAIPEPGNGEQYINAWFLRDEGTGDWVEMRDMSAGHVRRFLGTREQYCARIRPQRYDGTPLALQMIEDFLAKRK